MKAAVFTKTGELEIRDMPVPDVKDDEVLIKIKAAGICGTDIHIYKGEYFSEFPLIPGHEFSGVVEKKGGRVEGFKEGDRVTADPNIFCESCYFCKRNRQNHCQNIRVLGVTENGAFAEYVAVPYKNVFALDESVSFDKGAFVEPLACIAHGMDLLDMRFGSEILIVGGGPIGQLLLQSLNAYGGADIVLTDIDKNKLQLAEAHGANRVVLADGSEREKIAGIAPFGFDYVIDATGIPRVVEDSISYLKKAGTYLIFGVCPKDSEIKINPYEIFLYDWKILGSFAIRKNFPQALNIIASRKINTDKLVSVKGTIDDFPDLLQQKLERTDVMKVQVHFS